MSVTQHDIARALGVSQMTISLALRHSPRVSLALRQKIARTAERMGFRVNAHARGLATQRLRGIPDRLPIALLNLWNPPSLSRTHPYFQHILEGCRKRAGELGYYLEEIEVRAPGMTARRVNDILRSRGIRGALIAPTPYSHSHLRLEWEHLAATAIGFTLRRPNLHRTALNMALSIQLTLHHLKHARYKRIGVLLNKSFDRRMDGLPGAIFTNYQKDLPAKNRVPIHWSSWNNFETGLRPWLKKHRPDVIMTYWVDVYQWLREAGYSIPDDIGFVALGWYEGMKAAIGLEPTGISTENHQIGARAVEMVVGQMERQEYGIPDSPTIALVTPRWIPGATIRTTKRES